MGTKNLLKWFSIPLGALSCLVVSCAHQPGLMPLEDGQLASYEESSDASMESYAAEEATTEAEADQVAVEVEEASPTEEITAHIEIETEEAPTDSDAAEIAAAETDSATTPNGEMVASNEAPASNEGLFGEGSVPNAVVAANEVAAVTEQALAAPVASIPETSVLTAGVSDQNVPYAPVTSPKKKKSVKRRIAKATQEVKAPYDRSLNRYYFLRAGDSPEYLSKLFYGNADRAMEITRWNGPSEFWKPGMAIYFKDAEDSTQKMQSFYQAKLIATEDYVVREGDTLASIAADQYGDSASAKELAHANGLRTDSPVTVGKLLKRYPAPLISERNIAQAPIVVEEKKDAVVAKVEAPVAAPLTLAPAKVKREAPSSMMAAFFNRNPLLIACTLAVSLLSLGFYFMQRRRRSRFDF